MNEITGSEAAGETGACGSIGARPSERRFEGAHRVQIAVVVLPTPPF